MISRIALIFIVSIVLILHTAFLNYPAIESGNPEIPPPFIKTDTAWVDSVINNMSNKEKIAQMFMYPVFSQKNEEDIAYIEKLIKDYKIGGLIFMKGSPHKHVELVNRFQAVSPVPLLIAIDGEWGISMRLDSTIRYPRQMMLGAITNEELIYEFGQVVAKECKRIGVQVNFAPVIDINNNPSNPVIGSRSFGENKKNVARKGYYYMKGMQDNNILAVGKHFPGHGDTDVDSHLALPVINHSLNRLDSIELYPFKQLINQGLGGIMIAHLFVPALDSSENTATTLSYKVVTKLLKNKLKYEGLIFTDALNMKGVSKYFSAGEVDLKALLAGNDVLLFPANIPKAIEKIQEAIDNGQVSMDEINKRCKKILAVKYWTGLNNFKKIKTDSLYEDLNNAKAKLIKHKLIENAITLVTNKDIIPLESLEKLKIASVVVGDNINNEFQKTLNLYAPSDKYNITKYVSQNDADKLIEKLSSEYNLVIVSFHNTNRKPSNQYGISNAGINFAEKLSSKTKVIIDIFANPYSLKYFKNPEKFAAIIVSYNDWAITQNKSAQLIFGGIASKGKLPVSISSEIPYGTGITGKKTRLKYSVPEEVNMNSSVLLQIDSVVLDAIEKKAMPGCQILVAKNGVVVYHKAFGYHTYMKKTKVKQDDIYDLASITKVAATTTAIMRLCKENKISIDSTISTYLSYLDTTDKKDISIKDIMSHNARLKPWIPFYLRTIKNENIKNLIYRNKPDSIYNTIVTSGMYIRKDYRDTIFRRIAESKLRAKKEYKYSDIGYYWLYQAVEKITGKNFSGYLDSVFYKPIGANTLCFNPANKFNINKIVPTEIDTYFRHTTIHGYVHDMGAAMLGGVCGHAGLFSNANDLAKLMQMLLQYGNYGDKQYLDSTIINKFNTCLYCPESRRGIGFDKPEMNYNKVGPTCRCVSKNSFGHTGFTGTMAWADPDRQIVYIFLSNRTFPDMKNKKLLEMDIRTKIQEIIYQSIN